MVARDDYIVGQFVYETHVVLFHLQGCLLLYVGYDLRYVYFLEVGQHLGCVVKTVQGGNVAKQRSESLCLCITSLKELLLYRLVGLRVVENRLQISLYACHRSLQFMGDVLCELPLQYVLLLLGVLQSFIPLDNLLRNLAQLITRKRYKVFCFETFVVVSPVCEGTQLHYVHSESVGEPI